MKSSIKIGEELTGFLMRMDEDGLFQSNVWGKLGASMLYCQYHVLGQMLMAEGSKQEHLKKQFQDVLNHLNVWHLEAASPDSP